ncbi:MAG: SDR family oxidoreductase [Acidobacteria bacterium]|nr:SDR family oxidoreductase [Acidobacteriota bacterium]
MSFAQTIFLTGFPGFIAERLVERLARTKTQFFLLIQPQFVKRATAAVEKIAEKTNTLLENFALIEGDITLENLGIADDDFASVRDETTDVFHLAAAYDLEVGKDLAFKVNLDGTINANKFCQTLPHLRRYNYVSTCYVAGKRNGLILETELEHNAGFRNFYEESKYLAEREVEELKPTLPVTIYRPSVVVGDSETGETAKYDGIYYLVHYLRKAPKLLRMFNVGNRNVRLNLVPVDFVVESIAALAGDEAAVGKTLALADPRPLTTSQLFDAIVKEMIGKSSAITPPPSIVQRSLMSKISPRVTGLPHSAVPYFFIEQRYDTSVADGLLAPHNISCPNFPDYVGRLLDFVKENPRLE